MLFNSYDFAIFLVLCLSFHFALQLAGSRRGQNLVLLLASYVFYAAWDWRFLGLIALSTLVDYYVGLALQASRDDSRRRALVTLSLVINLEILGLFKYLHFFADGLRALAESFGLEIPGFALTVVLLVGISFYTFQTLSYTFDIYRRHLAPTLILLDFALFAAFFPQLVAGPIERAARLLPQVSGPRRPSWDKFNSGCWLILHCLARPTLDKIDPITAIGQTGWHALRVAVTFHLVCLGWLMFRADSLQHIASLLGVAAQGLDPGVALEWLLPLAALTAPLLLMQIAQARSGELEIPLRRLLPARVAVYASVFLMIAILGEDGGQPFVYFQV